MGCGGFGKGHVQGGFFEQDFQGRVWRCEGFVVGVGGVSVAVEGRDGVLVDLAKEVGVEGHGSQDDVAPFFVVGGEVFFFGEEMGFEDEVAKTGEGVDHFGIEMALDAGAEESGKSVGEVAGGVEIGSEIAADLDAGIDGEATLQFAFFVEIAKAEFGLGVRHVAVAAVVEGEGTETGLIVGEIEHRKAPES